MEERIRDVCGPYKGRPTLPEPSWRKIVEPIINSICFPAFTCDTYSDIETSYFYLVDLDNEVLSFSNQAFFNLWQVPRNCWSFAARWLDDGRKLAYHSSIPKIYRQPPRLRMISHEKYHQDQCNKTEPDLPNNLAFVNVRPRTVILDFSQAAIPQILALILYEEMIAEDAWYISPFHHTWHHEDFVFREVAFAILSLAATKFSFVSQHQLNDEFGYIIEEFVVPKESETLEPLPIFCYGAHLPNVEPGSAPHSSIYWFENILVSLVPDCILEGNSKVAIDRLVKFGLREGRNCFQGLLFSISNFLLLEVFAEGGRTVVKKTDIIPLPSVSSSANGRAHHHTNTAESKIHASNHVSRLESYCQTQRGFNSLCNFFLAAQRRALLPFTQGIFPTEIYMNILKHTDIPTREVCAKVSESFKGICQKLGFAFTKNLFITKCESVEKAQKHHSCRSEDYPVPSPIASLAQLAMFTFQYQFAGSKTHSRLEPMPGSVEDWNPDRSHWYPIFGDGDRKSMIRERQLTLQSLDQFL